MKRRIACLLVLAPALVFAQRHGDSRSWRVEDSENIQRSFTMSGNDAHRLVVDNISGFVHVTGGSGNTVQVAVTKRIRAVSDAAMQEAKRDVKLDMNQQGNSVRLYVDGPFRNPDKGTNYRGDEYYGYRVSFDFEVQVPTDTELVVKTLNDPIEIKKTTGDYTINGLNGGIDMQEVTGSGIVHTLNGPVKVAFTRNPSKSCDFKSLNGSLDVYFQPGLNADLSFKTLNGGIYTDFDVVTRPTAGTTQTVNGKTLYRVDGRNMSARTGSGGPEMKFDTLNGSIRLRSKGL